MHVLVVSYLVGFLGAGSLSSATPGTLPPSVPPAKRGQPVAQARPALALAYAAGWQAEDAALPPPRADASTPPPSSGEGKMGTIVEEPAPAPHELPQPSGGTAVPSAPLFRDEPAPMPREQTPPARFGKPGVPHDPSLPDVQSLHREIENLRVERAAMLAEETDLTTARDLRTAKSAQADLQKRIVELIAKVAQQAKKEKEAATASSRTPARDQKSEIKDQKSAAGPTLSVQSALPVQPPHRPSPSASAKLPEVPKQNEGTKKEGMQSEAVTDAPVDPLALAQSLFRAGDYAAALDAYRKLDKEDQKLEDRITIQYMMACCLRKLGQVDKASLLYREVANSSGNEFVVENAQWYLRAMKERRELEAQLEELRQRRQAMTPRKP